MEKRSRSFADLAQLGKTVEVSEPQRKGQTLGIVEVRTAGYVPPKVTKRAEMSPFLFTAMFQGEDLEDIRKDPEVSGVRVAEQIPLQKMPG